MTEYIKRDVVLDYAYNIRPVQCDYFDSSSYPTSLISIIG